MTPDDEEDDRSSERQHQHIAEGREHEHHGWGGEQGAGQGPLGKPSYPFPSQTSFAYSVVTPSKARFHIPVFPLLLPLPLLPPPQAWLAFCTQIYLPEIPLLFLFSCSKLLCRFPKSVGGKSRQKASPWGAVGGAWIATIPDAEWAGPVSSLTFWALERQLGPQ